MTSSPAKPSKELLLVCGMHRSGTSLVTKCFELFGYGLGETLMEPSEDNPKGFFEDLDVVYVNDWLLRDNGSHWDAPVFVGQTDLTWSEQHLAAAQEMMAAKLERTPRLAVKDPRVCLLLPFWREVARSLGVTLKLCLVYRNPLDIAASLARRNTLPQPVGLALTQAYWSQLLRNTTADDFVISYDRFLEGPQATLERVAAWMGQPVDAALAAPFVSDFMDAGMRHHAHSLEDLQHTPNIPPALLAASEVLVHRSQDETAEADTWKLATVLDGDAFSVLTAHQLSDRLALLEASTAKAELLEIEFAQRGFELEDITRQKAERETHITLLEDRVAAAREELRISQAFADERVEALAKTQADFEQTTQRLTEELGKTQADFEQTTQRLADEELRSSDLADELAAEVTDKAKLAQQLRKEESNSQAIAANLRDEQETNVALKEELAEANKSAQAQENKADWLFHLLETDYGRVLQYEQSLLGRVQRLFRKSYRLLTLQRGKPSAYDHTVAAAATFFSDHGLAVPSPPPSKRRQIMAMVRYTLAHPISSLRSMSPARFRKVLSVVRSSDADDLETWVGARFPEAREDQAISDLPPIPADEILVFPGCDQPKVSILIPVYNEWVVTHRCLWSILQHTQGDYEVIVADDCSSDETRNIADYVQGITVVRQEENQRFLKNCNSAAQRARGDFLLLLNNDTTVTEGWLPPLLKLFDQPEVGIAGPKLLFPNGKLQEAGGIIWQDASGWNYGRADDPSRPQYSYVRETDYVSGAALMVRRSLWQQLGGFDETFTPAYYEDTDLCFCARQAGYKVLYQPASSVVHYEGVTNGTDLAEGQKQYQVVNQKRFLDKWRETLDGAHFPNGEQVNRARDRSRGRTSVLVIDHYVPHYDKDAGSRSTWMYIEQMVAMGWRVQFMGANFFPHPPYTERLQQMGVEVLVGEAMARNLDKWLGENLPCVDHIFLHRPHIAEQFLPHLKKQAACPPISFVGHDLHFLRTRREFEVTGDDALVKESERWLKREKTVIAEVDHALYFSDVEVAEINALLPEADARAIPLYTLEPKPVARVATEHPELLFVAGFNHPPNIDAAVWLVSDILPLIRDQLPDVRLHIAGSNPSKAVLDLASDSVTVHGYVSDERLLELYGRASCAVVPLRFGAGVKGKVLEAIQYGVPLVTTTVGAEGIPDAQDIMAIGNDEADIADSAVRALQSQSGTGDAHGPWLEQHFSPGRAQAMLQALVARRD